jgi:hypothetical protein
MVMPDDGGQRSKRLRRRIEGRAALASSWSLLPVRRRSAIEGMGGAMGPIWVQMGLVGPWSLYLLRWIRPRPPIRKGFRVRPASRGNLGLQSRAWWW